MKTNGWIVGVRTAISLWTVLALLCAHAGTLEAGEVVSNAAAGTLLRVADFGAVGDGVHDDGPAIAAAFDAAKEDGGPSTVVFEKKTYRLGDNPAAWHYFQMEDHEDLVIEGKGATLLCSEANLALFFDGGRNITVRGLVFDTIRPTFTQGEVVAVDEDGALDVRIMEGYIRNITRAAPGVFRFHVKEDYLPSFADVAVGNWVTYGFNKATLPAAEKAAKDKSASIYAQIAADRVENITFEDIDIVGSLISGCDDVVLEPGESADGKEGASE